MKRGLPNGDELNAFDLGLKVVVSPAKPGSKDDSEGGYLAFLSDE